MNSKKLEDEIALVTGASRSLGAAIAKRLAAETSFITGASLLVDGGYTA